ncbi:MAG: ATP-dependent DNA helicase RecG [Clostridiales Family XIII bacterium]|jgi:ATP-dependent DNA helicase RecG|nr:ATP-dependent DNA helicase RecG [Clostridiales Family XIII bacterium]
MPSERAAGALLPESPVKNLAGVGPKKLALLEAAGIRTVADLLYAYPRTYEDRTRILTLGEMQAGQPAAFVAQVLSAGGKARYIPGRKKVPYTVLVGDGTGTAQIVFFNATWLGNLFLPGRRFLFFGSPEPRFGHMQFVHPDFERLPDEAGEEDAKAAGILPVYPLKAGLAQREMRRWHKDALSAAPHVTEYLPDEILGARNLPTVQAALTAIHYPDSREALKAARARFIYEELFLLAVGLLQVRARRTDAAVSAIKFPRKIKAEAFEKTLPFTPTAAQQRVLREVYADMEAPRPMNRLVQGDVGSGKTAVAMGALFKAVGSGYQGALMAPTEILARQHHASLRAVFPQMSIALLTASATAAQRREILASLAAGEVDILIGTHALLQPDVAFARLGVVITDEQHRFGVSQRINLKQKGKSPDVLVMTATPIPRTLAFILYGDLDMSVIDEMPPGRKPVMTKALTSARRDDVYEFVARQLAEGRQAYIVAPRIEEDEAADASGLRSAEGLYAEMQGTLSGYEVALLHGGMKREEKERVMEEFRDGKIRALVSTVVIEVGIDVKNATVMVIENAERFGLAQLHQLRGRVGRGSAESYCFLLTDSKSEEAIERARTMTQTENGFEIAEKDLALRGPGEFFGVRQHGIPNLALADLSKHAKLLGKVKADAEQLLKADPELLAPRNEALRERIDMLFADVRDIGI